MLISNIAIVLLWIKEVISDQYEKRGVRNALKNISRKKDLELFQQV